MGFNTRTRRRLAAAEQERDDWQRRTRQDTKQFGELTGQYVDLLVFAEAFAEELEGRRGGERPIEEILTEYRESHPFD